MAFTKRLSAVGNSTGLTIDQPILKQVGWETGTEVEIRVEGESLVLTRHRYADRDRVRASAQRMGERHRKSLEKLGR